LAKINGHHAVVDGHLAAARVGRVLIVADASDHGARKCDAIAY
jgi:hypothetical protein